MHAISYSSYGGPEVLELVEATEPAPRPGEVVVRVQLAGVNPFDAKLRSGQFADMIDLTLPHVPGAEVVGVVTAVGDGVTDVSVGDQVVGWAEGGYAQSARVRTWAPVPAELSAERAVALPVAGEAALRALRALDLAPGETVLINGASGNVGSIASQVAVRRGLDVIGTAAAAHHDDLRALGVRPTEYGEGLVERVRALAPDGVAGVLDAAGHGVLPAAMELRGGTDGIVTLADDAAFDLGIPFLSGGADDQTPEVLAELVDLALDGLVLPAPREFALADAAAAHAALESGGSRGKIVLRV